MLLFAGLGNPGPRYAGNRHNIGFLVADEISQRHAFKSWRSQFHGSIARGRISGEDVLLLKPMTYMNDSGRAVAEALRFSRLELERLFVIHDEVELWPGTVRVKLDGGNAGHNGLRSISELCGNGYYRVRIGVGKPAGPRTVESYVLDNFAGEEIGWLQTLCKTIADSVELLVLEGPARFGDHIHAELNRLGIEQRTGRPGR
jgi:PTH1 family peptidyl-tRNA hydrolase